jgi:hypothetical protein
MSERKKVDFRFLLRFVNLWVIGGAILIACIFLFITISSLWLTRSTNSSQSPVTAVFNITPVLLVTQLQTLTPTSSLFNSMSPIPPSPPPGEIVLGVYVQVTGTGGDGLRLRDEPGLGSHMLLLGSEAEVFRVDDGPREIDGYTWWYLVGPFDENRRGWAVSNFLKFVQNP